MLRTLSRAGTARALPKKQERSQKYLSQEKEALRKSEEEVMPKVMARRGLEAVRKLREKPAVSGLLLNREQAFMGVGKLTWRERFVVLDPKLGHLAYWDVKTAKSIRQAEKSSPMHEYPLEDLMSIETNEYHSTLMLNFCRPGSPTQLGKALTLQADCEEDFDRWVEALGSYGMKEAARPVAACAA